MPFEVGIDLIEVQQIAGSIATHGERFLSRVYTATERAETHGDAPQLAARFAAKEATMKALRTCDAGIGWRAIEVLSAGRGGHVVTLSGEAAELAAAQGVRGLTASLTTERRHAGAIVIAEAGR